MMFRDVDYLQTPLRDKINDATNDIGPEMAFGRRVYMFVGLP